MVPRARSLEAFLEPASVAVIGASSSPTKLGPAELKNLVEGGYLQQGRVYPINPTSPGAFVYVDAFHLLPEVEKENRRFSMIALAVGVLIAVAIVMSKQ
jgi:predicted CoA-binding protein